MFYKIEDGDVATSNSADYIDSVRLQRNDQDDTITNALNHTANIGDDTYNDTGNHNVVDTMYEMVDSDHWLLFEVVHDTTLTDVKILDISVKYHTKVHT